MKKILVCEDEVSIRSFVVVNLERAGYTVTQAGSGEEALACFTADSSIRLALLDVMLPGIDGFETCRRLRELDGDMGIIMLTARTREEEKVSGLRMGADDYVTKPFSTAELIARIDALYRRLENREGAAYIEQVISGEFVLDLRTRRLMRHGTPVELTQVEFQLLELFFRNPGQLLSRVDILQRVWGTDAVMDDKIVDVNIRRLRMKVEADPSNPRHLQTVWGRGYRWNE
ncbi:MAG: response regulator transcription factor [Clostridia bacterium]|nr:response regulator transcription factor [Clostridia bacterium]